ncbi:unnamed protein product [Rhizophagus irregularis]|nr:unnamed protein product [Rhizophagus irregularis]CAB5377002.1 unnamed protein product [Rhizophagus irregularis]
MSLMSSLVRTDEGFQVDFKGEVIAYKMPSPVHALLAARLSYMLQSWSNQLFVYSELDITAGNNKTPAPENEEVGTGEGLEASVMQYLTC